MVNYADIINAYYDKYKMVISVIANATFHNKF